MAKTYLPPKSTWSGKALVDKIVDKQGQSNDSAGEAERAEGMLDLEGP